MAIASSCILVAISIIGAGICFYKKYGYSHYGSGHIRILSEDGSIEEEVLFTMYRNGDIQPRHPSCEKFEKRRGRNMGYVYADRSGNIIKNGIVNPLKSASLPLTSSSQPPSYQKAPSRPISIATPGDNRIMVEVERDITTELPSTQSSVIPTDDVISDDVISDESSSSSLPPSPSLSEKSTSTKNRAVDSKSDLLAIDEWLLIDYESYSWIIHLLQMPSTPRIQKFNLPSPFEDILPSIQSILVPIFGHKRTVLVTNCTHFQPYLYTMTS